MKKGILKIVALMLCVGAERVEAQMPYLEEVRALGSVAGQGLACGASKYDTFELLARAILISKAPNNELQAQGMYAYNEEKANSYVSKQYDGFYECVEINRRFNSQKIFDATLYADGTIKMPDGEVITPREPYDASQIYKKNTKIRDDLKAIYQGRGNQKVPELKIQASENEGDIQTIYVPEVSASKDSITQVSGVQEVAPIPEVQNNAIDDSGVRHIKRKK